MAKFFGLEFRRSDENENLKSFAAPQHDDGAVVVSGSVTGTYIDLEGTIRNEGDLVTKYRQLSRQPEIDKAINEIVNAAIIIDDAEKVVELILDDVPIQESVKRVIIAEFESLLDLINFRSQSHDMFKRWYIDGRAYYHVIVDENDLQSGIKEIRYIDPRKIRKIREVIKDRDPQTGINLTVEKDEYYVYNESGITTPNATDYNSQSQGIKIAKDSIIHVVSGLTDELQQLVLSYLHNAIRPLNMLRSMEDSTLIYFLTRSPTRRAFYIDTGTMPHHRASQYIAEMQNSFRTKLTYNSQTGEVKDQSKTISMLEDYWFQVREGGRGTRVDNMPGGDNLQQLLEGVQLFEDKLYNSLQVPVSRLKPEAVYSVGRSTEISRDEVNFSKFIDRLRSKFSVFFVESLGKQLVLRNIMTPDDYDIIRNKIKFKFQKDNLISELKELEIMMERNNVMNSIAPFIGKVVSWDWVQRKIMRMSDDEIEEEMGKIQVEMTMPQFMPPEEGKEQ